MARIILCLLATLALAIADPFHNGFVVKWSSNPADGDSFYRIPRTRAEAEAGTGDNVWEQVDAGSGDPFVVFCQPDNERFCPIFDQNGFVAGMQLGVPFEDIANNTYNYPHDTNELYTKKIRFGRETWVGTAFFVSPAVLEAGGRSDLSQGTLVELWLQYGPSYRGARQIPLEPTTLLEQTNFTLQNCVPTMGLHYYYNISANLPCEKFDPWFMLYKDTQITGVGFQNFGHSRVRPNMRHYDEEVPLEAVLFVLNDPPQCLNDWVTTDTIISLHVYFVANPVLTNTC